MIAGRFKVQTKVLNIFWDQGEDKWSLISATMYSKYKEGSNRDQTGIKQGSNRDQTGNNKLLLVLLVTCRCIAHP